MPERASKVALRRVAELLDSDRPTARQYLRRVQARVGQAVPYSDIVEAMESVGPDESAVAIECSRRMQDEPSAHRSSD